MYIVDIGDYERRLRRPHVNSSCSRADAQAPTAAAIAAGGTTEEVLACTGGLVVYIVDSRGHVRRLRRPQVSLGRACELILLILYFLTPQAPTAAAIAEGGDH